MTDNENQNPKDSSGSDNHDPLVRLGSFSSEIQALQAEALLKSEGINASIVDPEGGGFGLGLDAVDEFEMIVNQKDFDAAKKLSLIHI